MSAQRASQLVEAGMWLRLSGDHEGAKRLFEQALKLDPTNPRARQLLDSPPPAPPQPGTAARTAADLDWGMATGQAPTPPPIAPTGNPVVKPPIASSSSPAGTHTVRLGETTMPEIPEAPRFEDPHNEVVITGADDEPVPDNSTLVFGLSGIPVPPAAPTGVPTSGTMVFGSGPGKNPPPPAVPPIAPVGGTLVFGSREREASSPPVAPPQQGSGTLVFGAQGSQTPPPVAPVLGPGGGTLVFSGAQAPSSPAPSRGESSTMVFGSQGSNAPPAVAPARQGPASTMVFGSSPPLSRDLQVVTEPGLPAFAIEDTGYREAELKPAADPGRSSMGTLEFNFDDMIAGAPTLPGPPVPGPLPTPPVPYDKDDGQQTAWDRSNPKIDITPEPEGEGGGFDLISTNPPPAPKQRSKAQLKEEVATLLSGAKDLLDLDDHSGAMELISKALELDPADAAALKLKDRSERTLQAMFESKLGDMNATPRVKLKDDEIIWLNLDHRAGFVLAQIDGSVTFEDLFAVSGMARLDTARILAQLVEEGVISKG